MYRQKVLLILIVCLLSNFFIVPTSYTHNDHDDIYQAERDLGTSIKIMDRTVGNYNQIRSAMETLIGEYKSNEAAIKKANDAALTKASVALVAGAVAYVSGGSLAPAAYIAWLAVNDKFSADTVDSQEFIDAMGTLLSLMDSALSDVNTAYSMGGNIVLQEINLATGKETGGTITVNARGYINDYNTYMSVGAAHLPGYTKDSLYAAVQSNLGKVDSHSFDIIESYKHYALEPWSTANYTWVTWGLPSDYECDGTCTVMFRSPHEALTAHRSVCGYLNSSNYPLFLQALSARAAVSGCGITWYSCDSDFQDKNEKHELRTCTKDFTDNQGNTDTCGDDFRRCMGQGKDHNLNDFWAWISDHSDEADDQEADNPTPSPTPSPPPSTVTYTCGIHSGDPSGESSDHKTTVSGYSGSFYECQPHQTFGCGHKDLTANASVHASTDCDETNSNGDTCTVSYYQCQSHTTHTFPAIACGRSACSATVSSKTQHRVTCGAGHPYWSCNPSAVDWHFTPITCKRPGCSVTLTKCQNRRGVGCNSNGRTYLYHNLQ